MHEDDEFNQTPPEVTLDEAELHTSGPDDLAQGTGNQRARTSARELPLGSHFFSHLIETIFDSIIVIDLDGNIVYANESAYLSRGFTREEFLQMKVCDLVIPTLSEICMQRLKEGAGGRLTSFESIHLHKEGRHLHVEARGRLIDLNGSKYYVVVLRDISAWVAAEQRLKETEKLLNSILEHAPMPIYSATVNGTYRLVNPAWEKVTGKQKNHVIGHFYEELFSAGTAAAFQEVNRQIAGTGDPVVFNEIAVIKGEKRYFHTVIFPLRGDDGQVAAVGGISLDITQRKLAEDALRESETTLRTLIEANPETFFLINTQGIILAANRVMAQRLGKSPEEILGTSVYDHLPADVAQRRRALLEQVADTGRPARFEDSRANFHFDNHINPVFDLDGKVAKVAILGVDITARKHMEKALRESEERYRIVTEGSPAGVSLIQDGIFRYVNPFMAATFGYASEELIDRLGPLDLVHPDDRPRIARDIRDFHSGLNGEIAQSTNTFKGLRKDGSLIYCEVLARQIEFQGRQAIMSILTDITERKRAQEALQQFSQELEQRVAERTAELEGVTARMQYIIDTTPVVILTVDINPPYAVTFVSDQIRHLGYEPGEILGTPFFAPEWIHPDDVEKVNWAVERLFHEHRLMVTYRTQKKDKTYAWIQTNAKVVTKESGMPVEIVACWTDITRQKQLEQKLELLSGPEGKISVWRRGSEVLEDLAPSLMPHSWERVQDCLQAALRGETTSGILLPLQRRDGTLIYGLFTAGPLQIKEGDYYGAVGAIIELLHQKMDLH